MRSNDFTQLNDLYYKKVVLTEASDHTFTAPEEKIGDLEYGKAGEVFGKSVDEPAKIPGIGNTTKRAYLPYIGKLREIERDFAAEVIASIIAIVKDKLDATDGNFTGSEVDFRARIVVPVVVDMLEELGYTKGIGNVTAGYIARAVVDAAKEHGYLSATKVPKPVAAEPAPQEDAESHEHDWDYEDSRHGAWKKTCRICGKVVKGHSDY
jgi:hypothetical protein